MSIGFINPILTYFFEASPPPMPTPNSPASEAKLAACAHPITLPSPLLRQPTSNVGILPAQQIYIQLSGTLQQSQRAADLINPGLV
jgi:hypothetical protein